MREKIIKIYTVIIAFLFMLEVILLNFYVPLKENQEELHRIVLKAYDVVIVVLILIPLIVMFIVKKMNKKRGIYDICS